ncbi:MAG TPA: cytidylate kinase-like family protein [Oceanipulchritudo sp.]|nr:cytidylate kinase-like family protein [Oceanipulchritudo sp.]
MERCRAFIDSNFVESHLEKPRIPLAVTISRQVYSGSHEIAELMIKQLEADPKLGVAKWALFDRDLVHRILEDHNLPKAIARYMPEDRDRDFTGLINEILGLHPSLWELFHYTCDTIHKLAKIGNVILIGRGAHIITRNMPHVLHVRVVAPFEMRVQRAAQILGVSTQEAGKQIRQDDQARAAFVRSHFDEALDNPLVYHLTINTGLTSIRTAAQILCTALKHQ